MEAERAKLASANHKVFWQMPVVVIAAILNGNGAKPLVVALVLNDCDINH